MRKFLIMIFVFLLGFNCYNVEAKENDSSEYDEIYNELMEEYEEDPQFQMIMESNPESAEQFIRDLALDRYNTRNQVSLFFCEHLWDGSILHSTSNKTDCS